jgi:hypothetical protein
MFAIFVKYVVVVEVDIEVEGAGIEVEEVHMVEVRMVEEQVEEDTFEVVVEAYKYLYVVMEELLQVEHKVVVAERLDFGMDLEAYMY